MPGLTVGYGEEIITPPLGTELAGYGFYLHRRAKSVLDDLKVRALFLRNGAHTLVLISCDLLGLDVAFADIIRNEIASNYKINPEHVLLASIHTHSGPAIQSHPGLGQINPDYIACLPGRIKAAVQSAENDCKAAEFRFFSEHVEPIGYNRRKGNFEDIDSQLNGAVFQQSDRTIYLFNYACHPVTLGRTPQVSADWPGATIHEIEKRGDCGIFFQGFCGDIDPVTNMNRWGSGEKSDLELYAKILSSRLYKGAGLAPAQTDTTLKSMEKRIALPLKIWSADEIERIADAFMDKVKEFPDADRFVKGWKKNAHERREEFNRNPFLRNVPLQAISIGKLKIIALPGEVFSEFGLSLKATHNPLFTFGYANGNIGYLPMQKAYRDKKDYAAYFAPLFYTLFPFASDIENILVKESLELLS